MDISQPISTIMSTNLYTVQPDDPVLNVNKIVTEKKVRHIPVVVKKKVLGIVSSSDLLHFLHLLHPESNESYINDLRLKNYKIEEIMTKEVISLSPSASIKSALEIFAEKSIHAIVVVEADKLVGIVTTQDIIENLLKQ